jgi:Fe-Mn family superoxide dismutase
MPFELPPLPYTYDALEPAFDAESLRLHHEHYHAGYIIVLNHLLEGRPRLNSMTLETILLDIRVAPESIRQDVRCFAGGHLNHCLFWQTMGPRAGGEPAGDLRQAIIETFGDIDSFRGQFASQAMGRFGSGWVWLGLNRYQKLEVVTTPNEDSPIMLGIRPVLGLDLWEHAYYLKHRYRRAEHVRCWWNVVNWAKVGEFYSLNLELLDRRHR